jgi:hypothetical protein
MILRSGRSLSDRFTFRLRRKNLNAGTLFDGIRSELVTSVAEHSGGLCKDEAISS